MTVPFEAREFWTLRYVRKALVANGAHERTAVRLLRRAGVVTDVDGTKGIVTRTSLEGSQLAWLLEVLRKYEIAMGEDDEYTE